MNESNINPEEWLTLGNKYGWPPVILVVLVLLGIWGTRSVWKFVTPHINSLVDATKEMLGKQSEFIDGVSKHQEELKTLVQIGQGGHEKTHVILGTIGKQTEEIHRIVLDKRAQ